MRKSYKFQRKVQVEKKFPYNYKITAPELTVIDETGTQLGVLKTFEAVKMALDKGYDLVEVAPNLNPPVAKFLNYGSFSYQKEKSAQKQRKQVKSLETKSIRLSMQIGEHDKETKMGQAVKFLEKGHKLKIEMILRGREMQHLDMAKTIIHDFRAKIPTANEIEQDVSKQGNKIFLIIMPTKKD